jgi:hypothetical protein
VANSERIRSKVLVAATLGLVLGLLGSLLGVQWPLAVAGAVALGGLLAASWRERLLWASAGVVAGCAAYLVAGLALSATGLPGSGAGAG